MKSVKILSHENFPLYGTSHMYFVCYIYLVYLLRYLLSKFDCTAMGSRIVYFIDSKIT